MRWSSQNSFSNSLVPDANLIIRRLLMAAMLLALLALVKLGPDANRWNRSSDDLATETASSGPGVDVAKKTLHEAASISSFLDEDPDELDAAREEFAAIADREPLSNIEMPAYWRLIRWCRETPREALGQHTRRDLVFTDFVEAPTKLRGKPVHLKLRLMRTLVHTPDESHLDGISQLYEGWGVTDESRTNPYCVVFSEKPTNMPIGPRMLEDVTFDGYFLKLLSYDARDDKHRTAPLLIGKLVWHPAANSLGSTTPDWLWPSIVGGMLLLAAGVIVMQRCAQPFEKHQRIAEAESKAVSRWLTGLGESERPVAADQITPETTLATAHVESTKQ